MTGISFLVDTDWVIDHLNGIGAATQRLRELEPQGVQEAALILCLGTMLHSIGTANMVPSWIPLVAVDINPAVVTKIADRGSSQTIGLVTDVGLFLHLLRSML